MNKRNERDMGNKDNWDYEHTQTREPVKAPRTVVSVAFRHEDFEIVSTYAERLGKKISEFIREATLEKARGRAPVTLLDAFGSSGSSLWLGTNLPSTTQAQTREIERQTREPVTTFG